LRRALGEAAGGDRWIETMPGRGYRFIGPVVTEMEQGAMARPPQVDSAREPAPTPRADAERRQITAMSCDLIGILGGADGVGLEDLRDVVAAFQRCVSETVDRHDGFVVNRLGNAALVLFGYPAAHEYDAERAVRAGLELCAEVRTLRPGDDLPMRCRVGIATGMAIIGDLSGDGALQHREVIGDAPNLAGRLQMSIQPDIVAIEPATRSLIGNLFDYRDLGAIDTTRGCAVPRRRFPVGVGPTRRSLQPEATGAGMEVTKCLKPPDSGHEFGDRASVQAATRVNAEQSSKRSMCRPTRHPFRGRLIRLGETSEEYAQLLHRGSGGSM
jgi:class 3 adenylate cyclase